MSVRLLLADDHLVVRAGLRAVLEQDPEIEIVGEAGNGRRVIDLVRQLHPDLVLMDLRMPGLDGVEATRQVRAVYPDTQVLILTTYETDADILRAVEAGATGYLLKDATADELRRSVALAARGQSALAPAVASRLMERIRSPHQQSLSGREIEILELVAEGLTNKQIASRLFISSATVKSHLIHVFSKLGVDDRTQAVTTAAELGILRLDR